MNDKYKKIKKIFFKCLKEKGLFAKYKKAVRDSRRNATENYIFRNAEHIIDRSMWYDETVEGANFWAKQNHLLTRWMQENYI